MVSPGLSPMQEKLARLEAENRELAAKVAVLVEERDAYEQAVGHLAALARTDYLNPVFDEVRANALKYLTEVKPPSDPPAAAKAYQDRLEQAEAKSQRIITWVKNKIGANATRALLARIEELEQERDEAGDMVVQLVGREQNLHLRIRELENEVIKKKKRNS